MDETPAADSMPQLSKHRIEALVDGIFAVAMILLVPFASAVNNQFACQLAPLVYSSVMVLIAAGALLTAARIHRHPELCSHPLDRATWRAAATPIALPMAVTETVMAVPLAGLFPGSANFAFLLLFGLNPLSRMMAQRSGAAPAA